MHVLPVTFCLSALPRGNFPESDLHATVPGSRAIRWTCSKPSLAEATRSAAAAGAASGEGPACKQVCCPSACLSRVASLRRVKTTRGGSCAQLILFFVVLSGCRACLAWLSGVHQGFQDDPGSACIPGGFPGGGGGFPGGGFPGGGGGGGLYDGDAHVIPISSGNFPSGAGEGFVWLLEFYAPW